jgi:hypothetical protein
MRAEEQQPMTMPAAWGLRKHRFCATFPGVNKCKQGKGCPYAHSREEVLGPVCSETEERLEGVSPDFFMWTYKTLWCPIGSFHDWQECIYAHNYQDLRRDPRIGYSTQVCPDWERANRSPNYADRCPRGFGCGFAHGAKEQLYHPAYFHSVMCNDHFHGKGCPRGKTCAFFHKKKEKRASPPWPDHGEAIPESILHHFLQPDIVFPPFAPAENERPGKGQQKQQRHDEEDEEISGQDAMWWSLMMQQMVGRKDEGIAAMDWLGAAGISGENPQAPPTMSQNWEQAQQWDDSYANWYSASGYPNGMDDESKTRRRNRSKKK